MAHGLMYSGGLESNFADLVPGATSFTGSDGKKHDLLAWPPDVNGLRIWYMEKPGKHFVAVRVKDDKADVVLAHPLLLDPAKHMGHGKRFSAEPVVVDDEMALVILGDMLAKNPELRDALKGMRERLPVRKK
jgi:hypothetical protein